MRDGWIDRDVARMLRAELVRRASAIAAECEAATLRRAKAGEPLVAALRVECDRACRALDSLQSDLAAAAALAGEQTERRYREHVPPQ